jgi:hypothetical protein
MQLDLVVVAIRLTICNEGNNTGNIVLGIYNQAGTRLVTSASTARTANVNQHITIASTSLDPGYYYLAGIASESAAGTYSCVSPGTAAVVDFRSMGIMQEDVGSTALPSTMTPVAYTVAAVPMMGICQSSTL